MKAEPELTSDAAPAPKFARPCNCRSAITDRERDGELRCVFCGRIWMTNYYEPAQEAA